MCLGMVIGLYGILYLEIARCPERGWLIAAVGLTGKVLGPLGAIGLIWNNTWPGRSIVLCITNDFIWWIPFGLYLFDSWKFYRSPPAESLSVDTAPQPRPTGDLDRPKEEGAASSDD